MIDGGKELEVVIVRMECKLSIRACDETWRVYRRHFPHILEDFYFLALSKSSPLATSEVQPQF